KYHFLVLIVELTLLLLALFLTYNFISMPAKKTTFYLNDNTITTLLNTLNEKGYSTYAIDKYVLKYMTLPKKGWYSLEAHKVGRFEFFKSLHKKRAKTMHIKVYAGETAQELTRRLANDMKLDAIKLLEAYKAQSIYQQADIFSGQYTLARDADAYSSIDFLFTQSSKTLDDFINKYYHKKRPQFVEIKVLLIIASIIQKESNSIEEMPLISSVIYNRLRKNMKLQMDGTLNYGKFAHTIVTPERIKTDESAYNTYKHKGIPPAPLGTVSIEALEAAYHPATSKYLFFMLKKDGSHQFAQTYEEHLKNIRAFKSKSKEQNITKIKNLKISS
ncbi:MAG TPA: endolytic transglycosylase MltG, partial [Epsilonproteobacteria bacterium]|nr:endolytic transglycosylase MltG [Campylobacterota bacterium]